MARLFECDACKKHLGPRDTYVWCATGRATVYESAEPLTVQTAGHLQRRHVFELCLTCAETKGILPPVEPLDDRRGVATNGF